jgi:hypothetical protein
LAICLFLLCLILTKQYFVRFEQLFIPNGPPFSGIGKHHIKEIKRPGQYYLQ